MTDSQVLTYSFKMGIQPAVSCYSYIQPADSCYSDIGLDKGVLVSDGKAREAGSDKMVPRDTKGEKQKEGTREEKQKKTK